MEKYAKTDEHVKYDIAKKKTCLPFLHFNEDEINEITSDRINAAMKIAYSVVMWCMLIIRTDISNMYQELKAEFLLTEEKHKETTLNKMNCSPKQS